MTLTAKEVGEITRLLEESSFDELTLELDGLKLTVRRSGVGAPPPPTGPAATTVAPDSAAAPAPAVAGDAATQNVTAPLLGTYYRAPKPGAPPFVEVGCAVEENTIIGIIEVMKLMNTVRAGTRGRVADILAKDGALVEYGETLMRVRKATQE